MVWSPNGLGTRNQFFSHQPVKLTSTEWDGLVGRLNEGSRRKQAYLMRVQQTQIASELQGLTFTPSISERSREIAARNKSLPDRLEALTLRKKKRSDELRNARVESEMREATFKPDLSKSAKSAAQSIGAQAAAAVAAGSDEKRQVEHLMQYVSRGKGGVYSQ